MRAERAVIATANAVASRGAPRSFSDKSGRLRMTRFISLILKFKENVTHGIQR